MGLLRVKNSWLGVALVISVAALWVATASEASDSAPSPSKGLSAMSESGASKIFGKTTCGPIDVVFVIDDTASMTGEIASLQAEFMTVIVPSLNLASGGDFTLGLVTFKDSVQVVLDLGVTDVALFQAALDNLVASGGVGDPEASDEALNTVINGLDSSDRPPGFQSGDFAGIFRPAAQGVIFVYTDAPPSGFNDEFTRGVDDLNAHLRAVEAKGIGLVISAFTSSPGQTTQTVMSDYANTSGGLYFQGVDTEAATFTAGTIALCMSSHEIFADGFESGDTGAWSRTVPEALPVIVVNEIMRNPLAVADTEGEWFELFNPGGISVDINGWTISDNDAETHLISNGGPLTVPAGGYLVLGPQGDTQLNGGVSIDYVYSGIVLGNSADELVLRDTLSNEIDRVEWDSAVGFPNPVGASMSLEDAAGDNNVGTNWCVSTSAYGDGDLGTPGQLNDGCQPPVIVVNEIMRNPDAVVDTAGEWFELFNPGGTSVDINGWTVSDNDADTHVISNGGPLIVPAGGYLVLGPQGDTQLNGGVSIDYVYAGIVLGNSADELVLSDTLSNEIDRVEWDSGVGFPNPIGASMSLENAAGDNNVGTNWCVSTTPYGDGDLGTPGQVNDVCP